MSEEDAPPPGDDEEEESPPSGEQTRMRSPFMTPRASYEELEIRAFDGARLRAIVEEPIDGTPIRATIVLAHAMFARKSSFGRRGKPGLARALADRGFRAIAFDFRGHGDSAPPPGESWGYDDLVRSDLPAVVDYARAQGELPVVVFGHSLGGHVALAAQGTKPLADAVVLASTNIWHRSFEPSRIRWASKLAIASAMLLGSERANGLRARRMRLGTDDASAAYVRDLVRITLQDRWRSADGHEDYLDGLATVTVPVASVLGMEDRLLCHPICGEAFVRRCGGPIEIFRTPGGHMAPVVGDTTAALAAVDWALARVDERRSSRQGSST